MKFWNKENLKEALGVCQFYNVPDDFTASGIKVWHDSIQNGDIVFLRGPEETKGALVKNILSVKDKIYTEREFEEFLRGKRLNCNGRIEILKN